jgi:K+-transporting ATPase ATPase A chain
MTVTSLLGLIVSVLIGIYLLYALLRGEKLYMQGWIQILLFCAVLIALVPLLGGYMARVFTGERVFLSPVLGPLERLTYRLLRVDPTVSQGWKSYAGTLVVFSGLFWFALYLILRTQTLHPFNPGGFHSGTWDLSFNTASSFITNTNWQYYGGETTLSNFSQMAGLAVQNFISGAVGIVVAVALIRAIANRHAGATGLGNFWQDLTRTLLYILLPISVVGALVLVSQGVVQSLGTAGPLAIGPVASQEIIKELGTNGGGFFNVNSSFPFENPNALSNFLEMLAILVIPASLTFTYGRMVGNRRQGWTIFGAMFLLFAVSVIVVYAAEQHGTPAQQAAGVVGPNLEGKEVRFGIANSSLWTAVTTVTSCGAVNAALQSLTGIGGLVPMANMAYGESVFGGVGTGLYTMLLYVLLAVFIGGLMVGRTPEFLGKKIEAREIKLVVLGLLFTPLAALFGTSLATATDYGKASIYAEGPQGFSESLYAYLSQANNNGSAFAGYTGYYQPVPGNIGAHGITFADLLGGGTMMLSRFVPIIFVLAIAGALIRKRVAPAGLGTMRTDTPTFGGLVVFTVVLVGALTFLPALLLGPTVQGLTDRLF